MLLTIHAPEVENHLQREAARRGVSPDEYARHLLEQHLPPRSEEASSLEAGVQQWAQRFDAWVNSHERREPLPEAAFERASFYGGDEEGDDGGGHSDPHAEERR